MQPKYAQICKNMQIKYAKICKKYAKIYKSMFLHMVHLYALPTLLMVMLAGVGFRISFLLADGIRAATPGSSSAD